MSELKEMSITRKNGSEVFTYNGKQQKNATLLNFWEWSSSDLMSNATRGILVEFIVAMSLDLHRITREEWAPYDFLYNGIKIEVKSASYIQSWYQKEFSKIVFSIKKTKAWDYKTNKYEKKSKRQCDVYVFCLLKHKDQKTVNPLDLNQWDFYVLSAKKIEEKFPELKSITLMRLMELNAKICTYKRLKRYIIEESHYK